SMRMGTVMSILGTATGRAFAATLPRQQLEQIMEGALGDAPRRLDRSAVKDIDQEIREIQAELRRHGVVRATGRPIPSVNAFSAPAFDHEGKAVLVITALGHEDNFPADWNSDVAHAVRQAAMDVSLRLGYRMQAAKDSASAG
ncbi:MAG: IclR family transcriptional regulator C-terminal domain-containing protein, partial [Polaromonas sp.]